jgi:hypothetical protein
MHKKQTGLTVRLPSGKKRTHGGYSFLTTGRLPEHRRYVEAYLSAAREGMIRDLGPKEGDLTAAQAVLIDRCVVKLGILRCIEEHVRETGVFSGRTFNKALGVHYIAYSNSLRLDLQALGIDKRSVEPEMSLAEIIKEHDEKKTREAQEPAIDGRDSGQGQTPVVEVVDSGSSEDSGADGPGGDAVGGKGDDQANGMD